MLAVQIVKKYGRSQRPCAVVALSDGGVMVGVQIAKELHCILMLLMSADIMLPREPDALAGITSGGAMAYNKRYSDGEIDELMGEYHGYVEQEKLVQMHELNSLLGKGGTIEKKLLKGHDVILVSDGLQTGFHLDIASEFLKTIEIGKLIVAAPFASIEAVDRMHIVADDLFCLSVIGEYIDTDHYYDTQDVPDHDTVIEVIENLVHNWK